MDYNEHMTWLRRGFLGILSLILFFSLLGGAIAYSTNSALAKPEKVKKWLVESKIYDHFVDNASVQAQKSAANNTSREGSDSASLSDPNVQQAANEAFSSGLIERSADKIIDSNYAWLQGKTATPNFAVDFSEAKQTFAQKVGKYAEKRLAALPVCTNAQLLQMQGFEGIDALSITCRPPNVTPQASGAEVTQKIENSGDFLSNPVVDAKNLNPDNKTASQPYYVKLSKLPKAYQWGQKLPPIALVLALVSILSIVFVTPSRRRGLRRVGIIFLLAGALLVAAKFAMDFISRRFERRVFNNADVGNIQKALVDFTHHVQNYIARMDMYFGTAFLVIALIILIYLYATRLRSKIPKIPGGAPKPGTTVLPGDGLTSGQKPQARPKKSRLVQ
jgi:hypothetical protein